MENNNDKRCGHCVHIRPSDGYCRRRGIYVNALASESCFFSPDKSDPEPANPRLVILSTHLAPDGMKTCKKCGRTLLIDQFPKHPKSRDHHSCTCLECYSENMKAIQAKLAEGRPKKEKPVPELLPDGMKRCKRCGRVLPVSNYGNHPTSSDHLHPLCNECRSEIGRESYEKRCAKRGITPKPKRDPIQQVNAGSDPLTELSEKVMADYKERLKLLEERILGMLTDAGMVAALRAHGWKVTCTREKLDGFGDYL